MPDPKNSALEYLRQNKDKFPPEVLRKKLIEAGYSLEQIAEASQNVYGDKTTSSTLNPRTSFWDFKSVRVYTSTGEKALDALFGFFVIPAVIGFIFGFLILGFLGDSYPRGYGFVMSGFLRSVGSTLVEIGLIAYFWKRRRYIAYGLVIPVLLSLVFGFFAYTFFSIF